MAKNEQKKASGENGGGADSHLSLLSQYLIVIVPFICKIVFETVQNLKHLSNDAARKYAMKSGFWDESEETRFNKCLQETKNTNFKKMNTNASNSSNLENDLFNSYLDKILAIGSNISNRIPENKRSMNTFEFEAITDIMECLSNGKLDIKYLNKHLINQANVERFVESWAQQLKYDYNNNNKIKFDKKVYENPFLYISGLFSKNNVKQQKFKQCMQVIKRNLYHIKNDKTFKNLLNTLISDSPEETIENVLKHIQNDKINVLKDSISLSETYKPPKMNSKEKQMKELISKKFDKKLKFKQNDFMNLCDEAFGEQSFLFPKLTLMNKNKIITEIPQWEIEKLFKKYIKVRGKKVND